MHYLDYNEEKQHGTHDFPIEYYHVDKSHPRYNMPFHWHVDLEIIHILDGTFHFKLGDEELEAGPGDIIFINEGVIHGGTPENCTYECIVFDANHLLMHTEPCKACIRNITGHQLPVHLHPASENTQFFKAAGHLFDSMRNPAPGSELLILGGLFELTGIIYQAFLFEAPNRTAPPALSKMAQLKPALKYIEDHFSEAITLEDLSKESRLSTKYFCQYFRSAIHRTPMDYLNYYRIEQACKFFSTTNYLVTEVAFLCGYNDSSYFIKTFKRYKGTTPKQYCLKGFPRK